jgi:membrane complex biogenesis BtpA family protein
MRIDDLFSAPLAVIGVVHLPPLPGAPGCMQPMPKIEAWVLRDTEALLSGGVHGLIVENFGDAPYFPNRVPPETVAHMTALAARIRSQCDLPIGINVLRNDAIAGLAIAAAVGAQFVRVNVHTGARLTDQGIIQGKAHTVLRLRKRLGSDVKIFADVAVKHSAPLGARPLGAEVADTVQRGRADAIIVSGEGTGEPTAVTTLREAKTFASETPVLVGSGVSLDNLEDMVRYADGLIVGTAFKEDGVVSSPVSQARVRRLVARVASRSGGVAGR